MSPPSSTPVTSVPKRPSRSASAALSSGRAETMAVSSPGSMTTPLRTSTRSASAATTADTLVSAWSPWSGSTARMRISFPAPMCARVNRSTNSVAVRSGRTRKAE